MQHAIAFTASSSWGDIFLFSVLVLQQACLTITYIMIWLLPQGLSYNYTYSRFYMKTNSLPQQYSMKQISIFKQFFCPFSTFFFQPFLQGPFVTMQLPAAMHLSP